MGRNKSRKGRASRGVTLIETLMVMAVVGVLTAIAIPSYNYVTTTNRIAGEINGLLGDLQFARSEAIKEGLSVVVCISSIPPGTAPGTAPACQTGTSYTWNSGWIVFTDVNGDGTYDAGDVLLRVQGQFMGADSFVSTGSPGGFGAVAFNREGFATVPSQALITLHAATPAAASTRCLSITPIGIMTTEPSGTVSNGSTCS